MTGGGDLVNVSGEAFVSLLRLRLESPGVAVRVGNKAGLSLADVTCEALTCVRSGVLFGESGGRVTVTRSTLRALSKGEGSGITVSTGEATITGNTVIENFANGIFTADSPLTVKDSTISGNEKGVSIFAGSFVQIETSTLDGNKVGVISIGAQNVDIATTAITNSGAAGVQLEGRGAVQLDGVNITNGDAEGLVIGRDFNSLGEVMTVRNSAITGHLGHGIAVYGNQSILNLGTSTEASNNEITFNKGRSLYDARPDNAGGLITLNGTVLENSILSQPPEGTYSGPKFLEYDIEIVNENEVSVYE